MVSSSRELARDHFYATAAAAAAAAAAAGALVCLVPTVLCPLLNVAVAVVLSPVLPSHRRSLPRELAFGAGSCGSVCAWRRQLLGLRHPRRDRAMVEVSARSPASLESDALDVRPVELRPLTARVALPTCRCHHADEYAPSDCSLRCAAQGRYGTLYSVLSVPVPAKIASCP